MDKRTFIVSLFLVLGVSAFSLDLAGTMWGPERGGHGYYLKFTTEKDFEYFYNGEGGGEHAGGTYVQNGNEIVLTVVTITEWATNMPAYIKQKTIKCELREANSLFSQYKLAGSNGLELWSFTHKPKDGEKRMMNGMVVYVYKAEGKVNENARVREGPGLHYRFYTFSFEDEPEMYSALPKGSGVRILGYSENKTTVDGVEKPWYYCVFRKDMWEEQFGWIWGGLIDF
jgi:hypothetical protein